MKIIQLCTCVISINEPYSSARDVGEPVTKASSFLFCFHVYLRKARGTCNCFRHRQFCSPPQVRGGGVVEGSRKFRNISRDAIPSIKSNASGGNFRTKRLQVTNKDSTDKIFPLIILLGWAPIDSTVFISLSKLLR